MKYTFNILLTHLAWLVHVVTEMQVWSPDQPGGGPGRGRGGIIEQRIVSQLQGLVCGLCNLASCWLGHAYLLLIFVLQVLVLILEVLLAHVPRAVETVQQLHRVQPPAVPPSLWRGNIYRYIILTRPVSDASQDLNRYSHSGVRESPSSGSLYARCLVKHHKQV